MAGVCMCVCTTYLFTCVFLPHITPGSLAEQRSGANFTTDYSYIFIFTTEYAWQNNDLVQLFNERASDILDILLLHAQARFNTHFTAEQRSGSAFQRARVSFWILCVCVCMCVCVCVCCIYII
jgi:hypothetical protein